MQTRFLLGNLLDSSNALLTSAQDNLPNTIALIDASATVLQTQLDEKGALQGFTRDLNLLSQQLKTSDPDIRNLLDQGPADLQVVSSFVKDNRTDLGAVIANLATTGETMEQSRTIDRFLDNLTVAPIRNSRLVDIKFQLSDPDLADYKSLKLDDQTIKFALPIFSAMGNACNDVAGEIDAGKFASESEAMTELQSRLHRRAEDSEEVIRTRLLNSRAEIERWREYDYVIVNDDLDEAFRNVSCIVNAERVRRDRRHGLFDFVNGLLTEEPKL